MAGAPVMYVELVYDGNYQNSTTMTIGTTNINQQSVVAATNTGWKTSDTTVYVNFRVKNIGSTTLLSPQIYVSGLNALATTTTTGTSSRTAIITSSTATTWLAIGVNNANNQPQPSAFTAIIGSALGTANSTTNFVSMGNDIATTTSGGSFASASCRFCSMRISIPSGQTPAVGTNNKYQVILSVKGSYT